MRRSLETRTKKPTAKAVVKSHKVANAREVVTVEQTAEGEFLFGADVVTIDQLMKRARGALIRFRPPVGTDRAGANVMVGRLMEAGAAGVKVDRASAGDRVETERRAVGVVERRHETVRGAIEEAIKVVVGVDPDSLRQEVETTAGEAGI